MNRRILILYIIGIHMLLAAVIVKSDFKQRVQAKMGALAEAPSEITDHYRQMMYFHKRMDGNVPEGAVVFIGDSITQGLCVSAVISPSVNYGIGNDTTLGVLKRLPAYRSIDRASVVVLAIGINDINIRSNDEILENYRLIIDHIPKRTPIVLSAVLPIDEALKGQEWQGRNDERIKRLNAGIQRLANADRRTFFVDAGPLLVDASGDLADQYHDGDGVHLNSQGNSIWINALRDGIQKAQHGVARGVNSVVLPLQP